MTNPDPAAAADQGQADGVIRGGVNVRQGQAGQGRQGGPAAGVFQELASGRGGIQFRAHKCFGSNSHFSGSAAGPAENEPARHAGGAALGQHYRVRRPAPTPKMAAR